MEQCDLDATLHDALQDRATRDTIRWVHLNGTKGLLNSVISSIITKGEETGSISMESLVLMNVNRFYVDISNLFSRYHFPKLQRLDLHGCRTSLRDLLGSRVTSLTTLSLIGTHQSPFITLSQMLSILSASPNLQSLMLSHGSDPDIDNDWSSQIQLHHLKTLDLRGDYRCVFRLLNRLEFPDKVDDLCLTLFDCPLSDLLQTLGPYLKNCVRCRSPGRLRLSVGSNPNNSLSDAMVV
jgi:hypothetical protein